MKRERHTLVCASVCSKKKRESEKKWNSSTFSHVHTGFDDTSELVGKGSRKREEEEAKSKTRREKIQEGSILAHRRDAYMKILFSLSTRRKEKKQARSEHIHKPRKGKKVKFIWIPGKFFIRDFHFSLRCLLSLSAPKMGWKYIKIFLFLVSLRRSNCTLLLSRMCLDKFKFIYIYSPHFLSTRKNSHTERGMKLANDFPWMSTEKIPASRLSRMCASSLLFTPSKLHPPIIIVRWQQSAVLLFSH